MTITTYHASMSERQLQQSVIDAAQRLGWLVMHINDSRGQKANGFPDLVLAHGGQQRVIFAELKTQKGKLSPMQEVWGDVLKRSNRSQYEVVRPMATEDAISLDQALALLGDEQA